MDLGARVQFVYFDLDIAAGRLGVDKFNDPYLSLEPFAQFELGPIEARLGFLINISGPADSSFSKGGVWGLRAGVGLKL